MHTDKRRSIVGPLFGFLCYFVQYILFCYFLVVTDSRNKRDGRYIERLGFFNPVGKESTENIRIDLERVDYWLEKGAQTSERVASLLKAQRKALVSSN